MSNEHKPETVLTPNKGTGPVASAWKVMENTETETGSNRQLADAGLLGVCIVFLATMLSLSQKQIDTPLTVALVTLTPYRLLCNDVRFTKSSQKQVRLF